MRPEYIVVASVLLMILLGSLLRDLKIAFRWFFRTLLRVALVVVIGYLIWVSYTGIVPHTFIR